MAVTIKGPGGLPSAGFDRSSGKLKTQGSATEGFTITPSDTVDFTTRCRAIYVGVSGDIAVVAPSGVVTTYQNVPVGVLDVEARRVNATGTAATGLKGLI